MKKIRILIFTFMMTAGSVSAQFLANPSFEGIPGQGITPPGWEPAVSTSTPDTEPFDVDALFPSLGQTYVTIVSRGSTSEFPNTFESIRTELIAPLQAGNCYDLSIDITTRSDLALCTTNGYIDYSDAPGLNIFGSGTTGAKGNLLATSGEIRNMDSWQTFYFRIKPDIEISYLTLEIELSNQQYGFGNIALDNFTIHHDRNDTTIMMNADFSVEQLPIELSASQGESYVWNPGEGLSCTDCQTPELTEEISGTFSCTVMDLFGCPSTEIFIINFTEEPVDDLFIPNVFTPNNDGINDLFEIIGLPPYSSLLIFDSNGKQVFISDNYDNKWDGSDMNREYLPEGTYWYILVPPGFREKKKGHVYLKLEE